MLESWQEFLRWLIFCVPVIFSPGPANLGITRVSSIYGVKKSLPFVSGLLIVIATYGFLVGLGANAFLSRYPHFYDAFQYFGVLYVFYLAFKFAKMSPSSACDSNSITLKDGLLLQGLNAKLISFDIVMYSHFLNGNNIKELLAIIAGQILLGIISYSVWGGFGSYVLAKWNSPRALLIQKIFFSGSMVIVGIWMLLSN